MVTMANPVHPGTVLRTEFMDELGITAGKIAKAMHVPRTRIERVVRGERSVTADTASRLARLFGTTPEFWMNLQRGYDLGMAAQDKALTMDLRQIETITTR